MTLFWNVFEQQLYLNNTKKTVKSAWLSLNKSIIFLQAYANFGKRVKTLQSKLVEDKLPELKLDSKALLAAADISPIPSPDYDAPSPQSGELELVLPDEQQQQLQQQQQQQLLLQQNGKRAASSVFLCLLLHLFAGVSFINILSTDFALIFWHQKLKKLCSVFQIFWHQNIGKKERVKCWWNWPQAK